MFKEAIFRRLKRHARGISYSLRHTRKQRFGCPICAYEGPFRDLELATGHRRHAQCPRCGALERHRLQYLVLKRFLETVNAGALRVLHFAPEPFLSDFLAERVGGYETADLHASGVTHTVDMQDMPFQDGSFDLVFASHVREHVPDDKKAIREVQRILAPSGVAILPVPVLCETTVEYPSPNPHESDHVRAPGLDYFDRYAEVFSRVDLLGSKAFLERYQLFVWEDRMGWPTADCPLRSPMQGERHADIVPLCYK